MHSDTLKGNFNLIKPGIIYCYLCSFRTGDWESDNGDDDDDGDDDDAWVDVPHSSDEAEEVTEYCLLSHSLLASFHWLLPSSIIPCSCDLSFSCPKFHFDLDTIDDKRLVEMPTAKKPITPSLTRSHRLTRCLTSDSNAG